MKSLKCPECNGDTFKLRADVTGRIEVSCCKCGYCDLFRVAIFDKIWTH